MFWLLLSAFPRVGIFHRYDALALLENLESPYFLTRSTKRRKHTAYDFGRRLIFVFIGWLPAGH